MRVPLGLEQHLRGLRREAVALSGPCGLRLLCLGNRWLLGVPHHTHLHPKCASQQSRAESQPGHVLLWPALPLGSGAGRGQAEVSRPGIQCVFLSLGFSPGNGVVRSRRSVKPSVLGMVIHTQLSTRDP